MTAVPVGYSYRSTGTSWTHVGGFLGTFILTVVLARLASLWTLGALDEQPFWPVTGMTIALALILPARFRGSVIVGGITGQLVDFATMQDAPPADIFGLGLSISVEFAVGFLIGGLLFSQAGNLDRFRRTFIGFLMCFAMAGAGAATAAIYWQDAALGRRWLLSDAIGIFAATSLIFIVRATWMSDGHPRARRGELILALGIWVGANVVTYHVTSSVSYLVIAGLLWHAVRFGPRIAVPTAVASVVWACLETATGYGPFIIDGNAHIVQLQAYNATAIVSAVFTSQLALSMDERRRWLTSFLAAMPDEVTITARNTDVQGGGFATEDDPLIRQIRRAIARTKTKTPDTSAEVFVDETTGATTHLESRSVQVDDNYTLTITRDMTREAELLEQVKRNEERWRRLAASGYEGFIEVDKNQKITSISEGIAETVGKSVDSLVGARLEEAFPPPDWQRFAQFAARVVVGEAVRFDRSFELPNGESRWALISVEPTMTDDGDFDGCMILVLDTTDVHRLHAAHVQSELALAVAKENERHRLARTLHDGALQDFAAANMLVGAMRLDDPDPRLERAEMLLASAMQKLRVDAIGLDVTEAGDHGIAVALEVVTEKFALANSISFSIVDRGIGTRSGIAINILYRVAREALVNAIVHSQATVISVELAMTEDGYEAIIEDNGVGFEFARKATVPNHIGLRNMAELSSSLGGWCTHAARPGGGTRVSAWVPAEDREQSVSLRSAATTPI